MHALHRDAEVNELETHVEEWRRYWDDLSGKVLDWKLAAEARAEETTEIHGMTVDEMVPD